MCVFFFKVVFGKYLSYAKSFKKWKLLKECDLLTQT